MAAITRSPGHLKFDDNLRLYFGSGAGPSDAGDVYIVHDGSTFSIVGASLSMPSLIISDTAGIRLNDSAPLKFGTPGTDMVFTPDGTDVVVTSTGDLVFNDSVDLYIGTGKDLRLYHNGTDSFINSILGTAKLRIGLPNTDGTSSFYIEQTGANPLLTITSDAQWASYIKDNSATAYIIAEAGNNYFKIDTSNAGALMELGNATTNPSVTVLGSGTFTATGGITTNNMTERTGDSGITLASGVEIVGVPKTVKFTTGYNVVDVAAFTVPAGETWLITDCWHLTTTSWDGNGTAQVGVTADADGFLALANASLVTTYDESGGITGWPTGSRGLQFTNRGVLLAVATDGYTRYYRAVAGTTILWDVTTGTSTQGAGTLYMTYVRLP